MIRKLDPELVTARKKVDTTQEPDLRATPEHKLWLEVLGKAHLPAALHSDLPDVEKALKKSGLTYSTSELAKLSPLARPPAKQEVVLFTRKGKVVGYAVGATVLNT
jgi:hypothetical protein